MHDLNDVTAQVPLDQASRTSTERTKSQDLDLHSDSASLTRPLSVHSQSPDAILPVALPKLDEDPLRPISLHDQCQSSLIHWKSAMLIQQLRKMGFELWAAEAAIHIFGDAFERALQWLMENPDLRQSQICALLQHHPPTEISVDFEMEMMHHVCCHHQLNEQLLQKCVIQLEGDIAAAIDGLLGHRTYSFPGCDMSLGIVHTESPFSHEHVNGHTGIDAMSDLECVLGSALDEYKRGQADFSELVNKDLGYLDRSPVTPSPLSQSWSSPTSSDPSYPFGKNNGLMISAELRHFIGDLLE